jgi:small subunit ribosomal protein S18
MPRMNKPPRGRGGTSRDARGREAALRKQSRYLEGVKEIDSRDYDLLRRFVTEYGKIVPARLTGATPKQQRTIKRAVRRARNIGLMA